MSLFPKPRWCPRERLSRDWIWGSLAGKKVKVCAACLTPTKAKPPKPPKNRTADRKWSKAVRERDAQTCRRCGRPATDGAHVIAKSLNSRLRHDPDNGVALCRGCHDYMTRHPTAWKEWLEQYAPGLLEQLQEQVQ